MATRLCVEGNFSLWLWYSWLFEEGAVVRVVNWDLKCSRF